MGRDEDGEMPAFVPALELNRAFYQQAVAPLLQLWPHAAARVGFGSEVLGFDDERSTDHGWGPQLQVFVSPVHVEPARQAVDDGLPETFHDRPVRYGWDEVPVTHHVAVDTLGHWLEGHLGVAATGELSIVDWLLMPQQLLLEVTGGAVYHDDPGELSALRHRLAWYPRDVWLWLLACQWRRVAEEEAFVGRTAEVGDEIGSRLVAARVARELMRIVFLLCRRYWPYTKWFGSAFSRLPDVGNLLPLVDAVLSATGYPVREEALVALYEEVAARHNRARLTEPVDGTVRPYYGRPYLVLRADRFVAACLAAIGESPLRRLPLVGSVDQVADSTDLLSHAGRSRLLDPLYRRHLEA